MKKKIGPNISELSHPQSAFNADRNVQGAHPAIGDAMPESFSQQSASLNSSATASTSTHTITGTGINIVGQRGNSYPGYPGSTGTVPHQRHSIGHTQSSLLRSPTVHALAHNNATGNQLNIVACIDMCQTCFTMTNLGIPFNFHMRGLKELVKCLFKTVQEGVYPVETLFVAVIAHRPEINATFAVWRGTINASTDIDLLLEILDSKIRYVEEEAVTQQIHFNKKRSNICMFPSIVTYAQAIKDTFDTFPDHVSSRAVLLTSGTMHVNIAFVQDLFCKHKLQLYILVESCDFRRASNLHQSMYDLHALAASTNGSIDVFGGSTGMEILESLESSMKRLLSEKFFKVALANSLQTNADNEVSVKRLQALMSSSSSFTPRAVERLLNSYEIEGGIVNHFLAYRMHEGFQIVDINYEPILAGMDSSARSQFADAFLASSHDVVAWNVTVQLEKIISSVSIIVYDLNFRMKNANRSGGIAASAASKPGLSIARFPSTGRPVKGKDEKKPQISKAPKTELLSIIDNIVDFHYPKSSINVSVRYVSYQYGSGSTQLHIRDKAIPMGQGIYEFDKRISMVLSMLFRQELTENDPSVDEDPLSPEKSSSAKEISLYSDVVEKLAALDEIHVVHLMLRTGLNGFSLNANSDSSTIQGSLNASAIFTAIIQGQICSEIKTFLQTCDSTYKLSELKWLFIVSDVPPKQSMKPVSSVATNPAASGKLGLRFGQQQQTDNGNGHNTTGLSAIVVELNVTKSVFVTIKVQIVASRIRSHYKRCAGIPQIVFELLKKLNCNPLVLKCDLSKYCMPNWYGSRHNNAVGNALFRKSSSSSAASGSYSLMIPSDSNQALNDISNISEVITSNIANSDYYFDVDLDAASCAAYRSLLQNCYRPITLKSGDIRHINMVIMELVSAKIEVGFHVVHYHVSKSFDHNYAAFVSMVAVGMKDPSGFQLDCLIQCNIHCTSEGNTYSFGVGYCWPKCFVDSHYYDAVAAGNAANDKSEIRVIDKIENIIKQSQLQDEKIFSFYSVILPILCTNDRGLLGVSTPGTTKSPRPPSASQVLGSRTDDMDVSTYRYNRLNYADWTNMQALASEASLLLPRYTTEKAVAPDSASSAQESSMPLPLSSMSLLNDELLHQLHVSLTLRDEIFLPLIVDNPIVRGGAEKLYALMIGSSILFVSVPNSCLDELISDQATVEPVGLEIDLDFDKTDGKMEGRGEMVSRTASALLSAARGSGSFKVTIKALSLPLGKFGFEDTSVGSFIQSKVYRSNNYNLSSVGDDCSLEFGCFASEQRLDVNIEACKTRVRDLFMHNYVTMLYGAARKSAVKFDKADVQLAIENCKKSPSRVDMTNMIKKRMSLDMQPDESTIAQLASSFQATVGKLVKTIAPCLVFVEAVQPVLAFDGDGNAVTDNSSEDANDSHPVLFVGLSLLYRWEEVPFTEMTLSACPNRIAEQLVKWCVSSKSPKLLEMGEMLLQIDIMYLPPAPVERIQTTNAVAKSTSTNSGIRSSFGSSQLFDDKRNELPVRRWSFSQKGVRRPSRPSFDSADQSDSLSTVTVPPLRVVNPINVFREKLLQEVRSLIALDTLFSLNRLISIRNPDPVSLSLAQHCIDHLHGVSRKEIRFDFLNYQSAQQRTSSGSSSAKGSFSHQIDMSIISEADSSELVQAFMSELQRIQHGFSKMINFQDNFITVTRQWDWSAAVRAGLSSVPDEIVSASSSTEVLGDLKMPCWILLTASNDVTIKPAPTTSFNLPDDISSCKQLQFSIVIWSASSSGQLDRVINASSRAITTNNSLRDNNSGDVNIQPQAHMQISLQEVLVNCFLEALEICWRRVNQKYLLQRLSETFHASQFLLVPPVSATQAQSGGAPTPGSVATPGSKISPRTRPPIPLSALTKSRQGKNESTITSPRENESNEGVAAGEGSVDSSNNGRRQKPEIVVNNGKKIEPGCFSCGRQGEVVCDMYHSAKGTVSHEAIIRTLESQALSQFVVTNNERYFVSQDTRGNHFYMSFDQQTERDAKTVKLGLFGLCAPDPTFLVQLKEYLDPRLVEFEVKAISASLVTKTATNITSHVTFMKQASPAKQVAVKFPLPSFIKDSYLYCNIARQLFGQMQYMTCLTNFSPVASTPAPSFLAASGMTAPDFAVVNRQIKQSSEFIHPACFGYNMFCKPKTVTSSAGTPLAGSARNSEESLSEQQQATASMPPPPTLAMPTQLRKLTRNMHVMGSSSDLSSLAALPDAGSTNAGPRSSTPSGTESVEKSANAKKPARVFKGTGFERTTNPVFLGCDEELRNQRKGQAFDEASVLWQQNEFSFIFNNVPLASTGPGVGRSGGGGASSDARAGAKAPTAAALSTAKPVGFGLALIEYFPLPSGLDGGADDCTSLEFGKCFASDRTMQILSPTVSGVPGPPSKQFVSTGSRTAAISDLERLLPLVTSGQSLGMKLVPLTESTRHLLETKPAGAPPAREIGAHVPTASSGLGISIAAMDTIMSQSDMLTSSLLTSLQLSELSSTVDIHLRIYPTIPMQSKLLLDACRVCLDQAVIVYCMERLYCIPRLLTSAASTLPPKSPKQSPNSKPTENIDSSSLLAFARHPISPRIGTSSISSLGASSASSSSGSSGARFASIQLIPELAPYVDTSADANTSNMLLQSMIYCHDFVQMTKSSSLLTKFAAGSAAEVINFPCVLPKKQAFELKSRICDEFLKSYPFFKSSRVDTVCEIIYDQDINPSKWSYVQSRRFDSSSRLTDDELHMTRLASVMPPSLASSSSGNVAVRAPGSSCNRKLAKWSEFTDAKSSASVHGRQDLLANYSVFGNHFLLDREPRQVTASSAEEKVSSPSAASTASTSMPQRNASRESSSNVAVKSEHRLIGEGLEGTAFLMPLWTRNRKYSVEVVVNTRGLYVFAYNIHPSIVNSLRESCKSQVDKLTSTVVLKRDQFLSALGVPKSVAVERRLSAEDHHHQVVPAPEVPARSTGGLETDTKKASATVLTTVGGVSAVQATAPVPNTKRHSDTKFLRVLTTSLLGKFSWEARTVRRLRQDSTNSANGAGSFLQLQELPESVWRTGKVVEKYSLALLAEPLMVSPFADSPSSKQQEVKPAKDSSNDSFHQYIQLLNSKVPATALCERIDHISTGSYVYVMPVPRCDYLYVVELTRSNVGVGASGLTVDVTGRVVHIDDLLAAVVWQVGLLVRSVSGANEEAKRIATATTPKEGSRATTHVAFKDSSGLSAAPSPAPVPAASVLAPAVATGEATPKANKPSLLQAITETYPNLVLSEVFLTMHVLKKAVSRIRFDFQLTNSVIKSIRWDSYAGKPVLASEPLDTSLAMEESVTTELEELFKYPLLSALKTTIPSQQLHYFLNKISCGGAINNVVGTGAVGRNVLDVCRSAVSVMQSGNQPKQFTFEECSHCGLENIVQLFFADPTTTCLTDIDPPTSRDILYVAVQNICSSDVFGGAEVDLIPLSCPDTDSQMAASDGMIVGMLRFNIALSSVATDYSDIADGDEDTAGLGISCCSGPNEIVARGFVLLYVDPAKSEDLQLAILIHELDYETRQQLANKSSLKAANGFTHVLHSSGRGQLSVKSDGIMCSQFSPNGHHLHPASRRKALEIVVSPIVDDIDCQPIDVAMRTIKNHISALLLSATKLYFNTQSWKLLCSGSSALWETFSLEYQCYQYTEQNAKLWLMINRVIASGKIVELQFLNKLKTPLWYHVKHGGPQRLLSAIRRYLPGTYAFYDRSSLVIIVLGPRKFHFLYRITVLEDTCVFELVERIDYSVLSPPVSTYLAPEEAPIVKKSRSSSGSGCSASDGALQALYAQEEAVINHIVRIIIEIL
jgi:hypothetical protein